MTHEKNLLSMPSPLHSPASWRVLPATVEHRDDVAEQIFFTRTIHDISAISAGRSPALRPAS